MPTYHARDTKVSLLVSPLAASTHTNIENRRGGVAAQNASRGLEALQTGRKLQEKAIATKENGGSVRFLGRFEDFPFLMVRAGLELPETPNATLQSLTNEGGRRITRSLEPMPPPAHERAVSGASLSSVSTLTSLGSDVFREEEKEEQAQKSGKGKGKHPSLKKQAGLRNTPMSSAKATPGAGSGKRKRSATPAPRPKAGTPQPHLLRLSSINLARSVGASAPQALPQALAVTVNLSTKSFIRSFRPGEGTQDIKIDVFLNGTFADSSLVPSRAKSADGGAARFQIFSGTRCHKMAEKPWIFVPPGQNSDGSLRGLKRGKVSSANPEVRWKQISAVLLEEAEQRGLDRFGKRPPIGEYLECLAKLTPPDEIQDLQKTGGQKYGIIDVVISLGKGNKMDAKGILVESPQRMADARFSKDGYDTPSKADLEVSNCERSIEKPRSSKLHIVMPQFDGSPDTPIYYEFPTGIFEGQHQYQPAPNMGNSYFSPSQQQSFGPPLPRQSQSFHGNSNDQYQDFYHSHYSGAAPTSFNAAHSQPIGRNSGFGNMRSLDPNQPMHFSHGYEYLPYNSSQPLGFSHNTSQDNLDMLGENAQLPLQEPNMYFDSTTNIADGYPDQSQLYYWGLQGSQQGSADIYSNHFTSNGGYGLQSPNLTRVAPSNNGMQQLDQSFAALSNPPPYGYPDPRRTESTPRIDLTQQSSESDIPLAKTHAIDPRRGSIALPEAPARGMPTPHAPSTGKDRQDSVVEPLSPPAIRCVVVRLGTYKHHTRYLSSPSKVLASSSPIQVRPTAPKPATQLAQSDQTRQPRRWTATPKSKVKHTATTAETPAALATSPSPKSAQVSQPRQFMKAPKSKVKRTASTMETPAAPVEPSSPKSVTKPSQVAPMPRRVIATPKPKIKRAATTAESPAAPTTSASPTESDSHSASAYSPGTSESAVEPEPSPERPPKKAKTARGSSSYNPADIAKAFATPKAKASITKPSTAKARTASKPGMVDVRQSLEEWLEENFHVPELSQDCVVSYAKPGPWMSAAGAAAAGAGAGSDTASVAKRTRRAESVMTTDTNAESLTGPVASEVTGMTGVSVLRQIKSEREGVFKEDSILLGVRFLVA